MLEEKALRFDYDYQAKCVAERDYEALEMYVMELLMKGKFTDDYINKGLPNVY